jgi:CheY-like chemotaxis protein
VQNFQIDQARRTLEERAQQLAISSQYKSEFLANMSHELRTPLNSLLVLAKLLSENLDGNLTVKQVEFARTIHEAGADLLQLINDILDLSKVEAGKMEVHPAAIALDTLLDYVDATFRPTAAQKGLTFEIEVNPDVPALIYSDEQRLQQILRNLLSNAVKFTADGGVTLRVAQADPAIRFAGPLRDEASVLAFAVADTGIGIAEHKLELIFGAFQQADGTTSRGYGGTGLGLSISRDIARLLGGEIHATSRLGHGSTFTFYLPGRQAAGAASSAAVPADSATTLAAAGAPNGAAADSHGQPEILAAGAGLESCREYDPLSGAKILIVDDDVRNVFALTSVFERYGAQIRYAENGRQGMEILDREDDIALVLMDVMMPELDGYATTAAIRRRPEFADLPIITVTAKAMKGDRAKSIASGASEYVTKPVDISHLIGLMRGWLERRPRPAGLPRTQPRTEGSG